MREEIYCEKKLFGIVLMHTRPVRDQAEQTAREHDQRRLHERPRSRRKLDDVRTKSTNDANAHARLWERAKGTNLEGDVEDGGYDETHRRSVETRERALVHVPLSKFPPKR